MPRPQPKKRTKQEQRDAFLHFYLSGCRNQDESDALVAKCEKRAGLPAGAGAKILLEPAIQLRLQKNQMTRLIAQSVSKAVGELADKAAKAEAELKAVQKSMDEPLDADRLKKELAGMVYGLDMDSHPREKLNAIQLAMVLEEVLEVDGMRPVPDPIRRAQQLALNAAPEEPEEPTMPTDVVYRPLFDKMRREPEIIEAQFDPPEKVVEVAPPPIIKRTATGAVVIPAFGESIDEAPPKEPSDPSVIIVDL